jgi:hypothetical protein
MGASKALSPYTTLPALGTAKAHFERWIPLTKQEAEALELKIVEVAGKTYAEVMDGKPVYRHSDGKETPFDAAHSMGTIGRLNGEAKGHRERAEAAEAKLKGFEGIEDPEVARKAMATVAELDSGSLVKLAKVEEIRNEAKKAAEEQVKAAAEAGGRKIKELEVERNKFRDDLYSEKVGGSFSRSKFIDEKVAVPTDMVQAMFGQRFKVEEGKIVGYDPTGNKIYSRSKPGDLADFDEALEMMVDAYPNREAILKGTGSRGDGARGSNGTGTGVGAKTMTRAAFDNLGAAEKMATVKAGTALVD